MKKSDKTKDLFLEQLKKTPIVQIACEKLGISRASFYRWRQEDKEFAKASDEAIFEGYLLVNDLAESQLISAVKDRHMGAVMYWLKHHHGSYRDRLEVMAKVQTQEELTEEQAAIVKDALRLASLIPEDESELTIHSAEKSYDQSNQSGTSPEAPVQPSPAGVCGTDDSGS